MIKEGSVSFVNDFKFLGSERFYIIENLEMHPLRAVNGTSLILKFLLRCRFLSNFIC